MGTININGVVYEGSKVEIHNRVIIDGVVQKQGVSGILDIRVTGDIASLVTTGDVTIRGNVGRVWAGGELVKEEEL